MAAYTFDIDPWTQAPCTYTETLTFSPDLASISWISVSGRTITVDPFYGSHLHGTSETVTVTSTLDDSVSTSDSGYTFTVTLNNPCTSTNLSAPSSPSPYTFDIGGSDHSWTIAAWS